MTQHNRHGYPSRTGAGLLGPSTEQVPYRAGGRSESADILERRDRQSRPLRLLARSVPDFANRKPPYETRDWVRGRVTVSSVGEFPPPDGSREERAHP